MRNTSINSHGIPGYSTSGTLVPQKLMETLDVSAVVEISHSIVLISRSFSLVFIPLQRDVPCLSIFYWLVYVTYKLY